MLQSIISRIDQYFKINYKYNIQRWSQKFVCGWWWKGGGGGGLFVLLFKNKYLSNYFWPPWYLYIDQKSISLLSKQKYQYFSVIHLAESFVLPQESKSAVYYS